MTIEMPAEVVALLEGPNIGHLASIRPDGSAASHPVWVGFDGEHVLICTGRETAKVRNVEHDPRVTVSIVSAQNPYEEAIIRGTVVEVRSDNDLEDMDRLSLVYTGEPFPSRETRRVTILVQPTNVLHRVLPFTPAQP